jgi:hypothetical protein
MNKPNLIVDTATAESLVAEVATQLATALEDLERAANDGDIAAVIPLRQAAQVDLPSALASARAALLDVQLQNATTEVEAIDALPAIDDAVFARAQAAAAEALTASEEVRRRQAARIEIAQRRIALVAQRHALIESAAEQRRAAVRRLAGLDAEPGGAGIRDISPVARPDTYGLTEVMG